MALAGRVRPRTPAERLEDELFERRSGAYRCDRSADGGGSNCGFPSESEQRIFGLRVTDRDVELVGCPIHARVGVRSEEHTSELQSRFGISYAVLCLKKKNTIHRGTTPPAAGVSRLINLLLRPS